jgi:hypothetical protein
MTYFAKVIEGRVHEMIVADQAFINSGAAGDASQWIETSKQLDANTIRKNPAQVGDHYDSVADAFYGAQPFPSWTLDTTTYQWQPPVAEPDDGKLYRWDETDQVWIERPALT